MDRQNQQENPGGHRDLLSRLQGNGKQKVFIFLVVVAVVVIPLSFWQLRHQLTDSLKLPAARIAENTNELAQATNTETVAPLTDLQGKDTDQDGLSDYDELYTYRTSPYLADSDSDGTGDQQEVAKGTDPNCPEGQNCGRVEANTNGATNAAGTNAASNTNTQTVDVTNLQPADLRQIMIDAGAPADQVNKIADADLLQTYRELLATEGTALTNAANQNSSSTNGTTTPVVNINTGIDYSTLTYDQLYALQPAEIRQLLQEGGVPKETLDTYDDTTLQQVYRESLLQNLGSQTPSQ